LNIFPDTQKAAEAQLSLAELFALEKDLDQAEREFRKAMEQFSDHQKVGPAAYYGLGRIKEHEGQWDEALPYYQEIPKKYERNPLALRIPIYIARRYKRLEDLGEAEKYYKEAIEFYTRLESTYVKTSVGAAASGFHFQCLADQGRWEEGVEVLEAIEHYYSGTKEAEKALKIKERLLVGLQKYPGGEGDPAVKSKPL